MVHLAGSLISGALDAWVFDAQAHQTSPSFLRRDQASTFGRMIGSFLIPASAVFFGLDQSSNFVWLPALFVASMICMVAFSLPKESRALSSTGDRTKTATDMAAPAEVSISSIPTLATRWERLGALVIDYTILFIILSSVIYALSLLGALGLSEINDTTIEKFDRVLPRFIARFLYSPIFTAIWGATPGKKLLRIKVVSEDYQKLSVGRVILREVAGKYVSAIVLGHIWILFSKRNQTAWDYFAKTLVVKD